MNPHASTGRERDHLLTHPSTTKPLAMKGHQDLSDELQAMLIGSPSDEDEEEDDAEPGGTTEAGASNPSDAS